MLGFAQTAPAPTGSLPHSTGLIILYAVFVAFSAILLLVSLVVRWPGPDHSQETDHGSREGPRPVGPDPAPGPRGDQALWADFEREFAQYVARRKRRDRPKVGRWHSRR
jgi:hypothetical protein